MASRMQVRAVILAVSVSTGGCGASLTSETASTMPGAAQAGLPETVKAEPAAASRTAASPASTAAKKPADRISELKVASAEQRSAPSTVTEAADAFVAVGTPGNTSYKMGAQDVVEVSVFKVPELSKSVQVSEDGTINLPLLGEVQAAGRTARELERELTRSLGAKYLQKPQVSVFVKEYNSQRVTLEGGGVKKPGVYALKGRMTLLQLVATADGLTDTSDTQAVVFRQEKGKRTAAKFDIGALRSGETEDPQLRAGDVVVMNTSAAKDALNTVLKALPLAAIFAAL